MSAHIKRSKVETPKKAVYPLTVAEPARHTYLPISTLEGVP